MYTSDEIARANACVALVGAVVALGVTGFGVWFFAESRWQDVVLDHGHTVRVVGHVVAVTPSPNHVQLGRPIHSVDPLRRTVEYFIANERHELVYEDSALCMQKASYGGHVAYIDSKHPCRMSDGRDAQAVERALTARVGDDLLVDVAADRASIARVVGTSWIERPE
ncbi:MAG: hypothetical protein ACHREM_33970, partial [Polyangiales bacterium]